MSKLDREDDFGGFEDNRRKPSFNIYDSKVNIRAVKTDLLNSRDISFLGPVFLGSPKSQGAMVVYDTGSDWLTVKSYLTEANSHKQIDEQKTIESISRRAVKQKAK